MQIVSGWFLQFRRLSARCSNDGCIFCQARNVGSFMLSDCITIMVTACLRWCRRKMRAPYFKAGNLSFGLQETAKLSESELFAALDADMIAEPDWLRKMVSHLILDNDLALAWPPQAK